MGTGGLGTEVQGAERGSKRRGERVPQPALGPKTTLFHTNVLTAPYVSKLALEIIAFFENCPNIFDLAVSFRIFISLL